MITQERLKELLDYDPATGVFTWRVARCRVKAGDRAGYLRSDGYWMIVVDGCSPVGAHRLAWLWVHGFLPKEIDHRNLDRADNRIAEIRVATHSQNHANTPISIRNKCGFKGVHFSADGKRAKRWRAMIRVNGKLSSLGRFSTAEEAHACYVAAAEKAFGEFARAA